MMMYITADAWQICKAIIRQYPDVMPLSPLQAFGFMAHPVRGNGVREGTDMVQDALSPPRIDATGSNCVKRYQR
jgi:hypothetical protein